MSNCISHVCALTGALLWSAGPAVAQSASPEAIEAAKARSALLRANLDKAIRNREKEPRLQDLTPAQRKDLIEFVTGNLLFATFHELGHAHIQEMGLYVLGREEDAADSYAITALLRVGTDVTHDVLIQATKGWFLDDLCNRQEGIGLAFYDEHGLDKQRAYQIVCLMVGSDPDKFSDLADKVKMPEGRQETCQGDYSNASWSWDAALKPHLRAPDQPKQKITVTYGPPGEHELIAQSLKTISMMEIMADYAADRYVWRRPITFDVRSCGAPDLHWDLSTQKIIVCYEIAQDFANLYRRFGLTFAMAPNPDLKGRK